MGEKNKLEKWYFYCTFQNEIANYVALYRNCKMQICRVKIHSTGIISPKYKTNYVENGWVNHQAWKWTVENNNNVSLWNLKCSSSQRHSFLMQMCMHSVDGRSIVSLLVPLCQHKNVQHSKHNSSGRHAKVHRARAISLVQLPTAEPFILMSHLLSHFRPARYLIFICLDL